MAEFLDRADDLRKGGDLGQFKEDFDRVFNAISVLQSVHSKAKLDLNNIESVFAAFEMGKLINKLTDMKPDEIENLLISIRRLIFITLEKTIQYQVDQNQIMPNRSYNSFVELLIKLESEGKLNRSSIITFNYNFVRLNDQKRPETSWESVRMGFF